MKKFMRIIAVSIPLFPIKTATIFCANICLQLVLM